jgi:hypothetical protein
VEHVGERRVSETSVNSLANPLELDGFAVVPRVIDETRCEVLASRRCGGGSVHVVR